MSVEEQRMRFTVERYEQMVEAGILTEDDRVELLEGEILEMSPIHPPHASVVEELMRVFFMLVGDRARIRVQDPIRLPPDSEPEPDVVLARPGRYSTRHPGPDDILLVVEVVDTTHRRDRRKLRTYARSGVREAWFVDLPASQIEVHRDPTPAGYASVEIVGRDGTVTTLAFADVHLSVDEILG